MYPSPSGVCSSTGFQEGPIDVRLLMKQLTVDEHCRNSEAYYSLLSDWDFHHAKPFALIDEAPVLLSKFALAIYGLELRPEMTILDFGAGSGWTSRFLTQLGLRVIWLDVSQTALAMARDLYARQPVVGKKPSPKFSMFDGGRIDLPDASVDRVLSFDAFHHVPDTRLMLGELSRVLKLGGIVGFAEPGPEHSQLPASQYEMRNYKVIENDMRLEQIWVEAQQAGFTDLKVAVPPWSPCLLPLDQFKAFVERGEYSNKFVEPAQTRCKNSQIFFLRKGEPERPDSRQREGLSAEMQVELDEKRVVSGRRRRWGRQPESQGFVVHATVTNNGVCTWLPGSAGVGAVHLGCHLYDAHGTLIKLDYCRDRLTPGQGRPIQPGETIQLTMVVPAPSPGKYRLQFDMVSEHVCWFSMHGQCRIVSHEVEVVQ